MNLNLKKNDLTPRRLALFIIPAAVVLFGVSVGADLDKRRARVSQNEAKLALMREQARQIQGFRERGTQDPAALSNPLAAVEESAQARGLKDQIANMTQDGQSGIQVSFEKVFFNELVAWLDDLSRTSGLRVDGAELEAGDGPGLVRARLILK